MDDVVKKGRGRPPLPSADRRRHHQTVRVRDEMRARLSAAAASNQRSISEEIEHRLEQSFDREAIVRDLAKVMREEPKDDGLSLLEAVAEIRRLARLDGSAAALERYCAVTHVPPSTASLAADQIAAMLDHWND